MRYAMLPRSPRNILEQDSMTEHLNAYIKYIVWFSCIFFLWLSIRKEAPWAADRSQAVNQNIEISNCHALKHCKCGHFVFSVLINIRLNISHQLGIYCIMLTCYLLGICLFGKNGNFFTATKIWAWMTKIGRSMG